MTDRSVSVHDPRLQDAILKGMYPASTGGRGHAEAVKLANRVIENLGALSRCEYPTTCGGPWGQPLCLTCISYAEAHVWEKSSR